MQQPPAQPAPEAAQPALEAAIATLLELVTTIRRLVLSGEQQQTINQQQQVVNDRHVGLIQNLTTIQQEQVLVQQEHGDTLMTMAATIEQLLTPPPMIGAQFDGRHITKGQILAVLSGLVQATQTHSTDITGLDQSQQQQQHQISRVQGDQLVLRRGHDAEMAKIARKFKKVNEFCRTMLGYNLWDDDDDDDEEEETDDAGDHFMDTYQYEENDEAEHPDEDQASDDERTPGAEEKP